MSDLHDLLAKHRAVAERATKGPWSWFGGSIYVNDSSRITGTPVNGPCVATTGFSEVPGCNYHATTEIRNRTKDSAHIALNDPEVALALNRVVEEARLLNECSCHHRCGLVPDKRLAATLTQLHEVMQRKIGDEG